MVSLHPKCTFQHSLAPTLMSFTKGTAFGLQNSRRKYCRLNIHTEKHILLVGWWRN